jgi:septal ring factor EnvC (AmiA/AmiB activator)
MKKRLLNIIILLLLAIAANAQTKEINNLKTEQKKTMERLAITNKLLEENKKNTGSTLNRLNILNKQVAERKHLISQINEEIRLIDKDIVNLRLEINTQQKQVETLKNEYAKLMYHTYLRRNSHDKLMFILSANSLSQSYRRLRYLKEFSDYRKTQAKEIERLTISLNEKLSRLEKQRMESEQAKQEREKETLQLQNEQSSQKTMADDLKKQEKDLMKQLKAQEKQMNDLAKRVEKLIEEERKKREEAERKKREEEERKQRELAQKQGKPLPAKTITTAPTGFVMTKEEQLLAGNFEKNTGRMPWPVEKGIVTQKFGSQPHPTLQHVQINSRGIKIQTEKNSDARSIFDGEVTQRFSVPGSNNAVIVRHGIYLTVYTNLTDIYVKEGDKVTAKQKLGRIYSDPEDGYKTELFFMLYKDKEVLNPETFLAK